MPRAQAWRLHSTWFGVSHVDTLKKMADVYSTVRDAVINRKHILANYKGFAREMCPHIVGTKRTRPKALFYQFGGGSSQGLEPDGSWNNWRCIFLDELEDVTSEDGDWHTAPNYSQRQNCVDEIDVEVVF
jgi:hypothetical protein